MQPQANAKIPTDPDIDYGMKGRLQPIPALGPSFHILREMTAGSLSCMTASVLTNPLDVLRVRHQMIYPTKSSLVSGRTGSSILGVNATLRNILRDSGWRGILLPGIQATMLREAFYSSIRFGLYTRIKDGILYFKTNLSPFAPSVPATNGLTFIDKLLAGMLTGSLGSAISSPIDLVKIRMQYEYGLIKNGVYISGAMKGKKPSYPSTIRAFYDIWANEGGFRALFRGVGATMLRAGLLTGGQLSSYESAKTYFKSHPSIGVFDEGPLLHVICSVWSGVVAATFCAPADIVKTRLMCDRALPTGSTTKQNYKNAIDCFLKILGREGIPGLFKGWLPSYLRLAPHFIISLPLNEWFRTRLGVGNL